MGVDKKKNGGWDEYNQKSNVRNSQRNNKYLNLNFTFKWIFFSKEKYVNFTQRKLAKKIIKN